MSREVVHGLLMNDPAGPQAGHGNEPMSNTLTPGFGSRASSRAVRFVSGPTRIRPGLHAPRTRHCFRGHRRRRHHRQRAHRSNRPTASTPLRQARQGGPGPGRPEGPRNRRRWCTCSSTRGPERLPDPDPATRRARTLADRPPPPPVRSGSTSADPYRVRSARSSPRSWARRRIQRVRAADERSERDAVGGRPRKVGEH